MLKQQQIKHKYLENSCEITILIKKTNDENAVACASSGSTEQTAGQGRHVQNLRNFDIFIDDYYCLIYLDVALHKFHSTRRFDMKDVKNISIDYNTKEHTFSLKLPSLPIREDDSIEPPKENAATEKKKPSLPLQPQLDLWKLKRITDSCHLCMDNKIEEQLKPVSNYAYGFASKFYGKLNNFECDLEVITRMPEPYKTSPLQRSIDREIDEMKNFCRDQYKLNFVELQVPEGNDNPMKFSINFKELTLTRDDECLLHNLTTKPESMAMPDEYDQIEIDCGLISILLAICYDVRFTSNEPNCESGWTRSILTATLTYFETFSCLRDVVISFMRRTLTYPLYRNYELSKQCVDDCIMALQTNPKWILKEFLETREIFESNERSVFNHYYIDDYIRYLSNESICSAGHLHMLAYNLKNVLFDVYKKHLGLGLSELETELLKELITDIHVAASTSEDDDDDDDDADDDADSDDDSESDCFTSPDNTDSEDTEEENSVICKKINEIEL